MYIPGSCSVKTHARVAVMSLADTIWIGFHLGDGYDALLLCHLSVQENASPLALGDSVLVLGTQPGFPEYLCGPHCARYTTGL